jgi:NAD(P)-dependent dehydrogenase (short-subunit alcohol dehydrogenase family)
MRLAGEKALVTGSTAGIGRALAIEFAREGAAVMVTGRNHERGEAVVAEIDGGGGTAAFRAADLNDEDSCNALVAAAAERLGGLTILVNNAAGSETRDGRIAELDTAVWDAILRIDLTAAFWCARAAIPHMRRAGHGAVLNISSRQAERPSGGLSAYCVAKGGMNALTRAIAVEEASNRIRANTISPGYVVNERRDANIDPERRARYEGMHLTRLGTAADVAYAAVYLASRESEFLTGVNLQLDGGSSIARALKLG